VIVPLLAAFVLLTALYLILSLWSRSVRRERLEEEWDSEIRTGDRDAFIEEGLRAYDRSLRRKLILVVYVIPVLFVLGMIYVMNYR
jgi:Ca2+/Na+ antiporter